VFGEELLTKIVKTGLFIALRQNVGLAKIVSVSCLLVQKRGLHDLSSRTVRNVKNVKLTGPCRLKERGLAP